MSKREALPQPEEDEVALPSIVIKRINEEKVEPVPVPIDTRKVKGADLCSECYCNICMIAPTNSGKTTVLYKMLKEMAGKETKIICFVSTMFNDPLWLEIKKHFDKKGIAFIG